MTNKVKILIVEDETLLAQDISLRVNGFGYEVVETVPSVDKAVDALAKHHPDLVMVDIMLKGDKTGIDLGEIINKYYKIPFIFLTSHADKQLVEMAKKLNPYAYLLKPFNDREINIAIELALANFSNNKTAENTDPATHQTDNNSLIRVKDGLFLKKNNHFKKVSLDDILWLQAESNYTTLHTEKENYIYSTVLSKIQEKLPTDQFVRVHRSFIVNILAVRGFLGNMLYVGEQQIPVSKSYQEKVFSCFKTL